MKRQFSASQIAGSSTLRDQFNHFEHKQNYDLIEVNNEDKLSNDDVNKDDKDQHQVQKRSNYKVINKNATARILLSRAKVSKMQYRFPHSLNPVVPDIPETSK